MAYPGADDERRPRPHAPVPRGDFPVMTMQQPFAHAVQAHGPTVLRVCRAVLGPHADADDAWSETFLAALQSWPDLADDTNVEAWLVRVAHRKAIDVTRRRQRHAVPSDDLPEQVSTRPAPDSAHFEVWQTVSALPPRQRQAVAYHYLGGLPYADVADLIGGTPAAARRAAADGIAKLRRHPLFADEPPVGGHR